EAIARACRQQLLVDDARQELRRALVQIARRLAVLRMLEDLRKASLELPRREEEGPVDVLDELLKRNLDRAHAGEARRRQILGAPLDLQTIGLRLDERQHRLHAPP